MFGMIRALLHKKGIHVVLTGISIPPSQRRFLEVTWLSHGSSATTWGKGNPKRWDT